MIRTISSERPLVLYGAGGVTGRLIIEAALADGVPLLLAGRRPEPLADLARRYGLPMATATTSDDAALAALAAKGAVLLNAAGPFAATARPLAEAAIRAGVPYVDVAGEVDVLTDQAALDAAARKAAVPLVCAAGYGAAAGEGLALHTAARLEQPQRLRLGLDTYIGQRSAGAAASTVGALRRGNYEIADGAMRRTSFADRPWRIELDGERFLFAGAPMPEAWAAARSTGVPNVRAGIRTKPALLPVLRLASAAAGVEPIGRFMARRAESGGQDRDRPASVESDRYSTIVAEVWDAEGRRAASVLEVRREGYAFAAEIAVAAAKAVAGSSLTGFHTPGSAFGADFLMRLSGVSRRDLA